MTSFRNKLVLLSFLLLFLLTGSTISQSINTNQNSNLRNNLITYDYTISDSKIQFFIHMEPELNHQIASISGSVGTPSGISFLDPSFTFNSNTNNWTASLLLSSSTSRYIRINSFTITFKDQTPSRSYILLPFGDSLIDLKQGIDTRIDNFTVPAFSNLAFSPTTINTSQPVTISLNVDHPYADQLFVTAELDDGRGYVQLDYKGNGLFSGSTTITSLNFEKTNISQITFSWLDNFQSKHVDYYNSLNYTSPILTVINGTSDHTAPVVDINSLAYTFYDVGSTHHLNITVPITDNADIYDPFFQLGSSNSTFYQNYYMTYNNDSKLFEASIVIPSNYPEFLKIIYLEAEDVNNNLVSYSADQVEASQYANSYYYDFPVMHRQLTTEDNPDSAAPALVDINSSSSTILYNDTLSVDVKLSDATGFYDSSNFDNKQMMYFNTSDGQIFYMTGKDEPIYVNDQLQGLQYSFDVLAMLARTNFPTSVVLWKMDVVDPLHNRATYTNFDPFVVTIQYPDSWYVGSTSSSSVVIKPTTTTKKSFLPYPVFSLFVVALLPILKRSRKSQ